MGLISQPGIYDIPQHDYHHTEICDSPSISSSGLRAIAACPIKYWWNSPLNPNRPPESNATHFAIGKAAHDLILDGVGWLDRYHVLPQGFSRAASVKQAGVIAEADAAIAAGKTLIKADDRATVLAMADAIKRHPISKVFERGEAERTIVWKDDVTGVWLRCRPDFLPLDCKLVPDFKTTQSASPRDFERSVATYGYHCQAAMYLDGLAAVFGDDDSRQFYFVTQEKEPPYVVQPYQLDDDSIRLGRMQNRKAINQFAKCIGSGYWPGYSDDFMTVRIPEWSRKEIELNLLGV